MCVHLLQGSHNEAFLNCFAPTSWTWVIYVCARSKQHFSHFHNHPGLVSEVLMRKKEMEVLANLKNIVILDCDSDTLYKKVRLAGGFFFVT